MPFRVYGDVSFRGWQMKGGRKQNGVDRLRL
jgi:hypothetical protein